MGMSTHVVGFMQADKKWEEMKHIWEVCDLAGVDVPGEVQDFFGGEDPGDKEGREVNLGESLSEWDDGESASGYQVEVSKLPPEVQFIRFYNSW